MGNLFLLVFMMCSILSDPVSSFKILIIYVFFLNSNCVFYLLCVDIKLIVYTFEINKSCPITFWSISINESRSWTNMVPVSVMVKEEKYLILSFQFWRDTNDWTASNEPQECVWH